MYLVYKMLNIIWEGKFELNKKSTNIFQFYTDECNEVYFIYRHILTLHVWSTSI